MRKILVTGGTVFVSRAVAEHFIGLGEQVYVLNRGNRAQVEGVHLIKADRHSLADQLKEHSFDAVIDVCAYTGTDVYDLLSALPDFGKYILISSSAVYPETLCQPFNETQPIGANSVWGKYGTDKIAAENTALQMHRDTYILRPPYLFGKHNNLYREAFLFDCALQKRKFYVPGDGKMKLQFFSVTDLCRFIDTILRTSPKERIYNVGNIESLSVLEWAKACYNIVDTDFDPIYVTKDINQRLYFPFYNYEYALDISRQSALMPTLYDFEDELKKDFLWYVEHQEEVYKKPFFEFIDGNLV